MNSWTQPLCGYCFVAFKLGQGETVMFAPVEVKGTPDLCLVCGRPTGFYMRIDPALTEGMPNALAK